MELEAKSVRHSRTSEAGPRTASPQIAVCLIEENPLAEEYLRLLLEKDHSIRTVSLSDLPREQGVKGVPIFVLDSFGLTLPIGEYLRQLRVHYPRSRYVVLGRKQFGEELGRLLWFGIHAYLSHSEVSGSLLRAVHDVSQGEMRLPPQVLLEYMENVALSHMNRSLGREALTSREYQITELVKRRFSNKEIADMLRIRESTVKFHMTNIFLKLQITDRHELSGRQELSSASGGMLFAFNTVQE